MKKAIHLILIAFLFNFCNKTKDAVPDPPGPPGPPPEPVINKLYGGSKNEFFKTVIKIDGGYMACGQTGSNDSDVSGNNGSDDIWLVKLDTAGNIIWQKALGGPNYDVVNQMIMTSDGNFIIVGYVVYTSFGSPQMNSSDFLFMKVDASGNFIWNWTFGGLWDDHANSVIETNDGGCVIVGSIGHKSPFSNYPTTDAWMIKLDKNFYKVWEKLSGGSGDDSYNKIIKSPDGGYLLTGGTSSNDLISGYHAGSDAWVSKLDNDFNTVWQKLIGGSGQDGLSGMFVTKDGNYLLSGLTNSNNGDIIGQHGDYDGWVLKLDLNGNVLWQKTLGGTRSEYGSPAIECLDGSYLVGINTSSNDGDVTSLYSNSFQDAWLVNLDKNGTIKWKKTLGGSSHDGLSPFIQRRDSSFVLAGYSSSNDGDLRGNHGESDAWLFTFKQQ